ncbi:hypothetical protein ABIE32_002734 [Comamonas sp. 4034]
MKLRYFDLTKLCLDSSQIHEKSPLILHGSAGFLLFNQE